MWYTRVEGDIWMIKPKNVYILDFVIILLLGLVGYNCIILNGIVPTLSMYPTIKEGQKIKVLKVKHGISRGDIVVFKTPQELLNLTDVAYMCKRVIGLSGDTIKIVEGVVYINNTPLDESAYVKNNSKYTMQEVIVPKNSFFVLGDNREDSYDSRYWDYKFVPLDAIIGKMIGK